MHKHICTHTHRGTHAGTYSHRRQKEGPKDAESCKEKKLVEYVGFLPYAKWPLRRALGQRLDSQSDEEKGLCKRVQGLPGHGEALPTSWPQLLSARWVSECRHEGSGDLIRLCVGLGAGREGITLQRACVLVLFLQGTWGRQGGTQPVES